MRPLARTPAPRAKVPQSLTSLLLFAVLGGLILNLMPCVFPVLSIQGHRPGRAGEETPGGRPRQGIDVRGGAVISSMLALAAVLLALRAGGEQIGWGFQLQSPLFVTFMVYLLLAVGLNLSGVFEVGGGLSGIGDGLTHGDTYRASFFTGVLTTLVATPCTAPFMAAAVGAALTQSPRNGTGDFCGAGVGTIPALPAGVFRTVDAARAAEAGSVDGYVETGIRIPDVCIGGMAAVGAGPGKPRHSASAPRWPVRF